MSASDLLAMDCDKLRISFLVISSEGLTVQARSDETNVKLSFATLSRKLRIIFLRCRIRLPEHVCPQRITNFDVATSQNIKHITDHFVPNWVRNCQVYDVLFDRFKNIFAKFDMGAAFAHQKTNVAAACKLGAGALVSQLSPHRP